MRTAEEECPSVSFEPGPGFDPGSAAVYHGIDGVMIDGEPVSTEHKSVGVYDRMAPIY